MQLPNKYLSAIVLLTINIVFLSQTWAIDEVWLEQWANSDASTQSSLLAEKVRHAPEDCPALLQMVKAQQPQLAAKALRIMISTLGEMGQEEVSLVKHLVSDNPDLLVEAAEVEPINNDYMPDDLGVTTEESNAGNNE